jgi:hypothetical protein
LKTTRTITIVFVGFLFFASLPLACALSTWNLALGEGSSVVQPMSISQSGDGGYLIITARLDRWLSKVDASGTLVWEKDLGQNCYYDNIALASDGGFVILSTQGVLTKFDLTGNLLWNHTFVSNAITDLLIPTSDEGFLIGGTNYGYNGDSDITDNSATIYEYPAQGYLMKVDSAGNMQWNKTFSVMDEPTDLQSIVQVSDGGYAIAGTSDGQFTGSIPKIFFARTDGMGSIVWSKQFGVEGFGQFPTALAQSTDGGFVIAGRLMKNASASAPGLIKINSSGDVEWQKLYGGETSAGISSVLQKSDGGFVFAGFKSIVYPNRADEDDFWLVSLDSSGEMLWERFYNLFGGNYLMQVINSSDGGYLMAGEFYPNYGNYLASVLIKADQDGFTSSLSNNAPTNSPTVQAMETLQPSNSSVESTGSNSGVILLVVLAFGLMVLVGAILFLRNRRQVLRS